MEVSVMNGIVKQYPVLRPPSGFGIFDCDKDKLSMDTAKIIYLILSEKGKNQFFKDLYEIIEYYAKNSMKKGGINWFKRNIAWRVFSSKMLGYVKKHRPVGEDDYVDIVLGMEEELREMVESRISKDKVKVPRLIERSKRSYGYIKKYIVGERVIDYGAGDCLLAQRIYEDKKIEVYPCDIIDYNMSSLPLYMCGERGKLPFSDKFADTTILYTVLHHACDPLFVLDEAIRVTRKRLIIMEGFVDTPLHYAFNSFFDWFLNRVVKAEDVPVYGNYLITDSWRDLFRDRNLSMLFMSEKGFISEVLAPEFHRMYVLDVVDKEWSGKTDSWEDLKQSDELLLVQT